MGKDLEQIILAQWLIGKNLEDMDILRPTDFSTYRSLFEAIKADGIVDRIALCRKANLPVSEMSEIISANSPYLYESAMQNCFQERGREWLRENADRPIEVIVENLSKFTFRGVNVPEPTADPVMSLLDDLDRRAKEKPVYYGWSDVDFYTCGIRRSELTFIAARPSTGKSSFCYQGATNVAKQGKKVLFLALEMSENAVVLRHLLKETDLSNYQVRNGITKETWQSKGPEITAALDSMQSFYQNGNFVLFGREGRSNCDPADLKVIRELIRIHRPFLVVIDQLEQIKESGMRFMDKRSRFSHVTHTLQEIALQENIAVWCACQLNRNAEDRPPKLSDLKESGTIEEDATNVLMLHRESEKTEDKQRIQVEIAKQKDGRCGVVNLVYDAPRFTFYGEEWRSGKIHSAPDAEAEAQQQWI